MRKNKNSILMTNKIKSLLTKKESEIVQSGDWDNIKLHSPYRLKQYIKLARKLRDKYRDLTQRQKVAQRNTRSLRTIDKARVFDRLLSVFEKQYQKVNSTPEKAQIKLDHDQHYDIDGVTMKNGNVTIPSNEEISKMDYDSSTKTFSEVSKKDR